MEMEIMNVKIPIYSEHLLYDITVCDGKVIQIVPHEEMRKGGKSFSFSIQNKGNFTNMIWDADGRILLPGFTDIHMHIDKSHSLPFAPNVSGTLMEAINSYTQASEGFTEENIKERMTKTILTAIAYGTTTIRTHIDFSTRVNEETTFRGIRMALEVKKEFAPFIDIQVYPLLPFYPYSDKDRKKIEKLLTMDIDGIGGAPHLCTEPTECVEELFYYAVKKNLPLDLHTDESDDPNIDTVLTIADNTIKYKYEGKVVVDHLCSLSAMDQEKANYVLKKMQEAKLGAVTLPAANLYLQGRQDSGVVRRGVTRVKEMLEREILLATASDNICDPFHPFGRGDLLQIAQITGYAAHMGGKADLIQLLKMITEIPTNLAGQIKKGINIGDEASFVLFDSTSIESLFAELPQTRAVFSASRWLSMTNSHVQFDLKAGSLKI